MNQNRMCQVVPVLDLKQGIAVHAKRGDRSNYQPVQSRLADSDPARLALAFRDQLGLDELYIADLDAIVGSGSNQITIHRLLDLGFRLWIDCGLKTAQDAQLWRNCDPVKLIAGLETLAGPSALGNLVDQLGPSRVIFSLDLRDGKPLLPKFADWRGLTPWELAVEALETGIERFILLDLARVGSEAGPSFPIEIEDLRQFASSKQLHVTIGGGVTSFQDLERIQKQNADAALTATALHNGQIDKTGLDRFRRW